MKISVKAKPNSDENKVEKVDDQNFVVSVKEPPVNGMANRAIVKALSEYFHTSRVRIVSGHISRNKIVEVG
jgi:uncharacterized protein (TIGR00251 family)